MDKILERPSVERIGFPERGVEQPHPFGGREAPERRRRQTKP